MPLAAAMAGTTLAPGARGRVLIAEDETLIREDIRATLEQRGWSVCGEARTGREAIRLAESLAPDVALLDIRMPGIDGVQAARRIRGEHRTPVVMMTAYDRPSLLARSLLAGAASCVVKPVVEERLHDAIVRAVGDRPVSPAEPIGRTARRAEIAEAAKALFARRGYHATSIRDVADAVGLLKGSLYHHFDSKEEMLTTIVRSFLVASSRSLAHARACGGSPRGTLRRFVEARRALHCLDPGGASVVAGAERSTDVPAVGIAIAGARADDRRFLERVLEDGVADGSFRLAEPAALVAGRVLDVARGMAIVPPGATDEDVDGEAAACAAFALAAVAAASARERAVKGPA